MNCIYSYRPIGGYVKLSVYNTYDNLKTGTVIGEALGEGDIDTLVFDYDYRNIAISLLTHAFAGDSVLAERCATDFINTAPVNADETITLHQIADWYNNWKKTH